MDPSRAGTVFDPGRTRDWRWTGAVPSHRFKRVYDPTTGKCWARWQANAQEATVGHPINYEEAV